MTEVYLEYGGMQDLSPPPLVFHVMSFRLVYKGWIQSSGNTAVT